MSENTLFKATLIIWLAFATIAFFFFDSLPNAYSQTNTRQDEVIPIIAILAGTAMLSTAAVWFFGSLALRQQQNDHREKAKRGGELSRLERLAMLMDEEEIVELEEMLKEREYTALRNNQG